MYDALMFAYYMLLILSPFIVIGAIFVFFMFLIELPDKNRRKKTVEKCYLLYDEITALQKELNVSVSGRNLFETIINQRKHSLSLVLNYEEYLIRYKAVLMDQKEKINIG